jgi:hypothetical protein
MGGARRGKISNSEDLGFPQASEDADSRRSQEEVTELESAVEAQHIEMPSISYAPETIGFSQLRREIALLRRLRRLTERAWNDMPPERQALIVRFTSEFEDAASPQIAPAPITRALAGARLAFHVVRNNNAYFNELRNWYREMTWLSVSVQAQREDDAVRRHLIKSIELNAVHSSKGYRQMVAGETSELSPDDFERWRKKKQSRATG